MAGRLAIRVENDEIRTETIKTLLMVVIFTAVTVIAAMLTN